ncbi:ABC transporter permease [Pseudonocardia nantongensis]|uniref:ABC transporter permease n=1 Tax=Pseudonocardia nantongensis TaxID=1181885 RepID=UPI00397AFFD4
MPRLAAVALRRGSAVVLFLAVWELVPRFGLVDRVFLPPFSEVVAALWGLVVDGELAEHLQASLLRSVSGLVLAVLAAIPLGLLIGWYRPVSDVLGPLLELFRNTSALALLPVFVLLLGLGETSKIALVVFACTWPILLNTISAVRGVDPLLIKSARSFGLSSPALYWKVVLPSSVPALFTGVRLAAAYSILVLIAAELTGAKAGLGYLITAAQYNFQIPQMYAGILTISLLGLALNQLLVAVEHRLTRWRTPPA